ncbi:MAG: hypothetical protein ABFD12_09190 [Syntrophorhabdus sp.]
MGDRNFREILSRFQYLDLILVILSQAIIVGLFVWAGEPPIYFFAVIAVFNAAGLAIRARKTGRGVTIWVIIGIFLPVLIPLIGIIGLMITGRKKEKSESRPLSSLVHGIAAFLIVLVAAVYMDSLSMGITCAIVGIIMVLTGRKSRYPGKRKLIALSCYFLALIMIFSVKIANNHLSYTNAGIIIVSLEKYKEKTGTFPVKLSDLVPGYLAKIPDARYSFMSRKYYYYIARDGSQANYHLMFIQESPFARRVYNSSEKKWHSID